MASRPSPLVVLSALIVAMAAGCSPDRGEAGPGRGSVTPTVGGSLSPTLEPTAAPARPSPPTPAAEDAEVELVAVGDIASCAVETDEDVAAAIREVEPDAVALLGDLVYPSGTTETYRDCFLPAWGELVDVARPAVGNHDLEADGGAAYWALFGDRAGAAADGWYSYDLGAWHVVVLNANCELIGCEPGSAQHEWLVADLEAADAACVLAYWHQPMTSSGYYGRYPPVDPLWAASVDGGVDLVLTGHEHAYERFAPLGRDVAPDPDGVPMLTAGTGGYELRPMGERVPGSEVFIDDAFGFLRLTLRSDGFDWAFVEVDGAELRERDAGSAECRS